MLLAYGFIVVGGVFGMVALYIWAATSYGTLIACIMMSAALLSTGFIILMINKKDLKVIKPDVPSNVKNDPLAQHIPDSLKNDPRVKELLEKIGDNPIAATAGAVALGMIISRELTGD